MLKNKIFTITMCAVVSFMVYNIVLAYDSKTTHPNLTDITVELHNLKSNNKILQSEKYWIKKGSTDEDSGMRSINHFYDPVYNRTWKIGGLEALVPKVTARVWANDQARQSSYDLVFFASLKVMARSYIESSANQTYNKAIYEYIKGNKKEAFYALGHVLHLLQDLTSVPHTRADAHIGSKGQSSYEVMSSYKNVDDFKKLYENYKNYQIIKRNSLEDYFYNVALYTNNNFYSEDTIMSHEYSKPEIFQSSAVSFVEDRDNYYILGWDHEIQNVYKLAKKIGRDWKVSDWLQKYDVNDPLVFEDYWARLSKKAVLEGAGLIDLFFRDVESKKKDNSFLAMMEEKHGVGFFQKIIGDAGVLFSYIFGLNSPVEDVIVSSSKTTSSITEDPKMVATTKLFSTTTSKSLTTTAPKNTTTTQKTTTTTKPKVTTTTTTKKKQVDAPLIAKCDFVYGSWEIANANKKVILNEISWMGSQKSFSNEWIELKNISNEKVDISGWEILNNNKAIKIVFPDKTILNPMEMYLLERTNDDNVLHVRADLIYVGAIKNSNEELRLLDSSCFVMDSVKASPDWPAGSNEEKRTMERKSDFSWYTSSANCINGVCGTPKAENSPFLISFNSINPSTGGAIGVGSTTTTTLPGFTATTTTTLPKIIPDKKSIVFSEIKISGVTAYDEFVEIYNPLDIDVDLTGWSIKQKTSSQSNLVSAEYFESKIVPAKGYFLIANKKVGSYQGAVLADTTFNSESYSLVNNQSLILFDNYSREIDRVGWGAERIGEADCETICLSNLETTGSFERKANAESTSETMTVGIDVLSGNAYDTNNNLNDFVVRQVADPQNSLSEIEPRDFVPEPPGENFDPSISLKNFNFYYLDGTKDKVFVEFDVNGYPFWNVFDKNIHKDDLGEDDRWRAMVFYLNDKNNKANSLSRDKVVVSEGLNSGWQVSGAGTKSLLLKYDVCGGLTNDFYGSNNNTALILPYHLNGDGGSFVCDDENIDQSDYLPNAIAHNFNSGNHFKIEVIGILDENGNKNYDLQGLFKEGDYLSVGLYKGIKNGDEYYLDGTELIFEDLNEYFFDEDGFYRIEKPSFTSVEFDELARQYILRWDAQKNDNRIEYCIYVANREEQIGKQFSYCSGILKEAGSWRGSLDVEGVLFPDENIYFAIKATDVVNSDIFEVSEILRIASGKSAANIDWYMKNVEWKFEEIDGDTRMVLEFDFDRPAKYLNSLNEYHYYHILIPLWEFRKNVETEFDFRQWYHVANPNTYIVSGGISDVTKNKINNAKIVLGILRTSDWGHKKYIIRELRHPEINDRVPIRNEQGITLNELMAFVKSDANPNGVIENLADMRLVISYGMRYEPSPDYWVYSGDYQSFTPDTDPIGSQIKHYLQVPVIEPAIDPEPEQNSPAEEGEEIPNPQ